MSIILFIVILAVLILVHEFGHFIVAKRSGIRVDEFGVGFPPKIFGKKIGETEYTLNLFPIGGFVKIFGETPDEDSINGHDSKRSFVNKSKYIQAKVLVAGVFFNMLFAWLLLSVGFMVGLPPALSSTIKVDTPNNISLKVAEVSPGSPAEKAGLKIGDTILSIGSSDSVVLKPSAFDVQKFIAGNSKKNIDITFKRGLLPQKTVVVSPTDTIAGVSGPAIGIGMDSVGKLKLPIHLALWEGAKLTANITELTFFGLMAFFGNLFSGNADFSSVAGPVGIIKIIGDASQSGLVYLLYLTALISVNLAIINLIPFPALDGGRLLFLFIEKIKGSQIKPKIANTINAIGFALLILLMVVITYSDIIKLFA